MALVALTLSACGGSEEKQGLQPGTYTIGWAESKTGFLAQFDSPMEDGARLAVREMNADGGIDGKVKLRLVTRDMQTDPALGAIAVRELLDLGADFILVTSDADIAMPGARVAAAAGYPAMTSGGGDPSFPERVGDDLGFMNMPGTLAGGAAQAEYAYEQGHRTAYVLKSFDEAFTRSMPEAFEDRFRELGGRIVGTGTYSIGDEDFTRQARDAVASGADVIETPAFPTDINYFMRELDAAGSQIPLILGDGGSSPAIFDGNSPQLDETVLISPGNFAGESEGSRTFQRLYEERYGNPPAEVYSPIGYDMIEVIAAAVSAADSTEPAAVATALDELENVAGASGPITYRGRAGVPEKTLMVASIDRADREFEVIGEIEPEAVPPPRRTPPG